jgi:hypothetical protein
MTADHLSGIIERLEKANGPDRELDAEIHRAITPLLSDTQIDQKVSGWLFGGDHAQPTLAPFYSKSIDAALTLVPSGYGAVSMSIGEGERGSSARLGHPYVHGNAKTPAIALCIAALRARSHKKEG